MVGKAAFGAPRHVAARLAKPMLKVRRVIEMRADTTTS
jgi:hypothetical protein